MERSRWEPLLADAALYLKHPRRNVMSAGQRTYLCQIDPCRERVLREIAIGRQIAAKRGYHGHIPVDEALLLFDEDSAPTSPARHP